MATANINFIGVFVIKLWRVQALACGGEGGDGGDNGSATKKKFSNFGDIITHNVILQFTKNKTALCIWRTWADADGRRRGHFF